METEELRQKVESFERWHYQFDLGHGVITPIHATYAINRTVQRKRLFFDRLLTLTHGSLEGMRVLDLGCNAGYWSLCAIEAGADFVFGIDGRQMHIDQANLVFDVYDIDRSRYEFELGNFLKYPLGPFDLVLCLGVLYHVSSPVDLFNIMAGTGAELLVIDTEVSNRPGNVVEFFTDHLDRPKAAVDEEVVAYPTRGTVSMLAERHGYQVAALGLGSITDWAGMGPYRKGSRAAFICSKTRPLDALPREVVPENRTGLLTRLRRRLL
jgi:SAM-dependent methyltransferase